MHTQHTHIGTPVSLALLFLCFRRTSSLLYTRTHKQTVVHIRPRYAQLLREVVSCHLPAVFRSFLFLLIRNAIHGTGSPSRDSLLIICRVKKAPETRGSRQVPSELLFVVSGSPLRMESYFTTGWLCFALPKTRNMKPTKILTFPSTFEKYSSTLIFAYRIFTFLYYKGYYYISSQSFLHNLVET